VWVSEVCQLFLVPSQSSNTPLYPSKCCELRSVSQLLPLLVSFTWAHIWVLQAHLNIYVPRAFQWYKERHKPLNFDPSNRSLKFQESIGTPSPKVGVALGVWGLTPSHSLTLPGVCDVTLGLPLGPHHCNPFALVANPKLRLRHQTYITYWLNF
jgi:hypothetical protein